MTSSRERRVRDRQRPRGGVDGPRRQILDALAQCGGKQSKAAERLGLSYDQFRHYYRKYSERPSSG